MTTLTPGTHVRILTGSESGHEGTVLAAFSTGSRTFHEVRTGAYVLPYAAVELEVLA